MYLPEHKILFVHVPKTGGTSIQFWIQENNLGYPLKGVKHWSYSNIVEKHNNLEIDFSFSVVRNPWDLAVSWYFFKRDRAQRILDAGKAKPKGKMSREYNEWVLAEYDKGIDHWFEKMNPAQQADKVKGVDHVCRLENLNQDFALVQQRTNCHKPLGRYNFSNRDKDYRKYYTEDTTQLIAEKFAVDIETFGYEF